MKKNEQEKAEAIETLREIVKPGSKVYCILRHVSRSGTQREISLYAQTEGGLRWLDGPASKALGNRIGKHGGLVIGGCGMDMGFALVYELSSVLFRDGFGCIGEGCPSNDHVNGDRDYTRHAPRFSAKDRETPELITCAICGDSTPATYVSSSGASHTCEKHAHGAHWHESGGYALQKQWL